MIGRCALADGGRASIVVSGCVQSYEMAIGLCPRRASSFAALAFTHHLRGSLDVAIEYYHRALGLKPDDTFSSEMLSRALQDALLVGEHTASARCRRNQYLIHTHGKSHAMQRQPACTNGEALRFCPYTGDSSIMKVAASNQPQHNGKGRQSMQHEESEDMMEEWEGDGDEYVTGDTW